jgi:hypothetical protein
MSSFDHDDPDRAHAESAEQLRELAAGHALTGDGWTWDDERLARELGIDLLAETEAFELAAAEVAVAEVMRQGTVEAPEAVRVRLSAMAAALHGARVQPTASSTASAAAAPRVQVDGGMRLQPIARPSKFRLGVPLAAAAGVVFGVAATLVLTGDSDGRRPTERDPIAFVRSRPNAVHWPWVATGDPHVTGSVGGEAYFDPDSEDGILEIEGLAVNDPTIEQYQLWIFDAARDERYPVDGGVFDVTERGRVVIPVKARLSVDRPVMFAITVEKPGGAVVSARQIAMIAKP